jgi:hypothetical protein
MEGSMALTLIHGDRSYITWLGALWVHAFLDFVGGKRPADRAKCCPSMSSSGWASPRRLPAYTRWQRHTRQPGAPSTHPRLRHRPDLSCTGDQHRADVPDAKLDFPLSAEYPAICAGAQPAMCSLGNKKGSFGPSVSGVPRPFPGARWRSGQRLGSYATETGKRFESTQSCGTTSERSRETMTPF